MPIILGFVFLSFTILILRWYLQQGDAHFFTPYFSVNTIKQRQFKVQLHKPKSSESLALRCWYEPGRKELGLAFKHVFCVQVFWALRRISRIAPNETWKLWPFLPRNFVNIAWKCFVTSIISGTKKTSNSPCNVERKCKL
jgi:hypothetical protein